VEYRNQLLKKLKYNTKLKPAILTFVFYMILNSLFSILAKNIFAISKNKIWAYLNPACFINASLILYIPLILTFFITLPLSCFYYACFSSSKSIAKTDVIKKSSLLLLFLFISFPFVAVSFVFFVFPGLILLGFIFKTSAALSDTHLKMSSAVIMSFKHLKHSLLKSIKFGLYILIIYSVLIYISSFVSQKVFPLYINTYFDSYSVFNKNIMPHLFLTSALTFPGVVLFCRYFILQPQNKSG
jgi:hypothetical protein